MAFIFPFSHPNFRHWELDDFLEFIHSFSFDQIQSEPRDIQFQVIDANLSFEVGCLPVQIVKLNKPNSTNYDETK